jgi:amidase
MSYQQPTRDEVRAAAAELGIDLTDAECDLHISFMAPDLEAYGFVETLAEPKPSIDPPDRTSRRPDPEENALGAWHVRTGIRTSDEGRLAGRTVALSDNVCLAGVPMMAGTSMLRDYVPDIDATVVTRLLDAGATITGKAHCEYLGLASGSHTGDAGPVRNPHRPTHSSGGSSSGVGALVASGAVDLGIGTDASGSVRVPASWSGAVGMKPTHGLVPYTGILPLEATLDHVGPITATVADNALMLEILAGPDGLDPRQHGVAAHRYTQALTGECAGMRVGVVQEGFEVPDLQPDVADAVRAAGDVLAGLGARVDDMKLPAYPLGIVLWDLIALEGHVRQLLGNGFGTGWRGLYVTGLVEALQGWQARSAEFPPAVKVALVMGNVFRRRHGGVPYAKAHNLLRTLNEAYDAALADYDVLVVPTTPMKATELPAPGASPEVSVRRAFEMVLNTVPCNATGHPALNVPCAMRAGLPVGMMLIGRRWDEPTIYRVAYAFERSGDWISR